MRQASAGPGGNGDARRCLGWTLRGGGPAPWTEGDMRQHVASILAWLCLFCATAPPVLAACDSSTEPGQSDVASARAAVAANCDCAGAASRGVYVRCAAQQANATLVNKSCAGAVKKCAAKSTCGRPGAVTCCVTKTGGTRCRIKRDAAHCTASNGSTA